MLQELINRLQLQPHPEGGFYSERHRSPGVVTRADGAVRSALTLIDFVLPAGVTSHWHRVHHSDETWHYAAGAPLELLRQQDDGPIERLIVSQESSWQLIPAGWWQSARSLGDYTHVQCCVAPGFDFLDFEMRS
ncbi:cupin domain-containing protein [soil metagenome]